MSYTSESWDTDIDGLLPCTALDLDHGDPVNASQLNLEGKTLNIPKAILPTTSCLP